MAISPQIPARDALARVAEAVSKKEGLDVVLAPQQDVTFTVKSALVHPVQALENSYQRAIQEAGRREADPDRRQEAERKALARYFPFDAGALFLLGPDGSEPCEADAAFEAARAGLKSVRELAAGTPPAGWLPEARAVCHQALAGYRGIVDEYHRIGASLGHDAATIPLIAEIDRLLAQAPARIDAAGDPRAMRDALAELRPLSALMGELMRGVAAVQVFHVIDSFYLYRLLVRYQLRSADPVTDKQRRDASSGLTDLLNNPQAADDRGWLLDWLKARMREIDAEMVRLGNLHFHLKGGRALEYVRGKPAEGRNDWDTSVLIDSDLSPDAWYAKFTEVHNALVRLLLRAKREFFVLAHQHAPALSGPVDAAPVAGDAAEESSDEDAYDLAAGGFEDLVPALAEPDDDEPAAPGLLFPAHAAACKAELIDIGIPRRDTVEAMGHWHHIGPGIIRQPWTDGIPVPGHRYYVDEYLLMIRDALDAPSVKIEKRITRLANFLALDVQRDPGQETIDSMSDALRLQVAAAGLTETLAVVARQPRPVQRLLHVMLAELAEAHDLATRPGLRAAIDRFIAAQAGDPAIRADLRANLPAQFAAALPLLSPAQAEVLDWVALMHATARRLERHVVQKAVHFGFGPATVDPAGKPRAARRDAIMALLRWLQAEAVFRPDDQLEVLLAVTGSLAAALHAGHAQGRLPASLVERIAAEMDPVDTVELRVFCYPWRDRRIDPAEVMAALIRPLLDEYAAKKGLPFAFVHHPEHVDIVWTQPETIGEFTYAPLVARLSVVAEGWPLLSYVAGLPVLSLPDLARAYFNRASAGMDNLAARRLKTSAGLLTSMLTYFEVNDATDPDAPTPEPVVDIDAIIAEIAASGAARTSADRSEQLRQIALRGPGSDRVLSALVAACGDLRTPKHKAAVLHALLARGDITPAGHLALVRAIAGVGEGGEVADLLEAAARVVPLADTMLDAFLKVAAGISQPAALAAVLTALARRGELADPQKARIIELAKSRIGNQRLLKEVLAALGL